MLLRRRLRTSTALRAALGALLLPQGPWVLAQREPDDRLLEPGRSVQTEIAAGASHSYPLRLDSGHYLRLRVERVEADVEVVLADPTGKTLVEADTLVFPPGPLSFSVVTEMPGTYRLDVRLAPGGQRTSYQVSVVEKREATANDATRIAAERALLEGERKRTLGTAASWRDALESFERAVGLHHDLGDALGEANALTGAGRARDALADKQGALESFAKALALYRSLGQTKAAAYVLGYSALIHDHLGDRPRAVRGLEEALVAARECGDRRVEGLTLNNLGLIRHNLGDKQGALDFYNQALPLHRSAGNPRAEATTLQNIGTLYDSMGDRRKGLEFLRQALPLRRAIREPRDLANTLNNIGAVHASLDELPEAIEHYRMALEQWRKGGDQSGEAATLHNIARVHEAAGDYQEAITLHHQALPLFRATSSRVKEANALTSVGRLYFVLGDHQRALGFYEKALPVHRETGNRAFEATTLGYMGAVHAALGGHARALELYEQALRLRQQTDDRPGQAATLQDMGRALAALRKPEEALAAYSQALDLYRAVQSRRGEANTLVHQATAQAALGRYTDALAASDESLALFRKLGDRRGEASSLYGLARIEQARGELDAARAAVETALPLVESLRTKIASQELRASFLASVQDYYELHVDILMRLHRERPGEGFDARALHTSERARARSLLEILSEARAGIREGMDPVLLERERRLQQSLSAKAARQARLTGGQDEGKQAANLTREIEELTREYEALQAEIRTRSPRYAGLTQRQPSTLSEIQQGLLDPDTVLLEYALGAERSYLWVVTSTSLESHELPPRAIVEESARGLHEEARKVPAAEGVATENAAQAAEDLGRILLSPVAGRLQGKRLAIVADGLLRSIPMAALRQPSAGGSRPLILDHEVVTLPSASTLAVLRGESAGRASAAKAVVVIADPVFDETDPRVRARKRAASLAEGGQRGELTRLIGSRREAAAILALVPPGEGRQALDFEASRATATSAELARYRVVHFATHGLLDSVHPELSGVVLSLVDEQGRSQDGFLRLHDVYNLKLSADLVVLSACQTGLGKEVRGEGLVGLTRGFMYAGAPRVVATLWKVDDRATAELMRRFYAEMLGPHRRAPAAALRAAQVALWEQTRWRAPYYWAGFVLQGEWR